MKNLACAVWFIVGLLVVAIINFPGAAGTTFAQAVKAYNVEMMK